MRWLAALAVLCGLAALFLLLDSGFGGGALTRVGSEDPDPGGAAPSAPAPTSRPEAAASRARARPAAITGWIRGRIHDALGAGIPEAEVRIAAHTAPDGTSSDAHFATSDGRGSFEIEASGGTAFTICAEAAGFAPGIRERVRAGDVVDLELLAAATLEGLAVDDRGTPVAGAEIVLFSSTGPLELERTATSDSEGRWRLADLPTTMTASCWLAAEADGFAPYLTRELAFSRLLPINRFTIVLRRGGVVTGRVLDAATDRPIAGAKVAVGRLPVGVDNPVTAARFKSIVETVTSESGAFRLALVPGDGPGFLDNLVWVANAQGYAQALEQLPPSGDGREVALDLRLRPAGTVQGRVVDGGGRPVGGVFVAVTTWYASMIPPLWLGGRPEGGFTSSDGSYRLEGVAAGPDGVVLWAMKETGHRGWGWLGPLIVAAGGVTPAPDFVLAMGPAATVRVLDPAGMPVPGAAVEVTASYAKWQTWFTDAEGRVLVSFEPWPARQGGQPVRMRVSASGFVEQGLDSVVPDPDAPPEVVVRLAIASELRCRVVWADGSAAVGIRVGVADGSLPVAAAWPLKHEAPPENASPYACLNVVQTDEHGRCRFGGLPAGPWHLAAWADPLGKEPSIRMESIVDASKEVLITLEEPSPAPPAPLETVDVDVTVLDAASGRPVLDANVRVDRVGAFAVAPGVYRRAAVPRDRVRVQVSAREYPAAWEHWTDLRVPGKERVEVRLDPGVVVKGRARLPAGLSVPGAEISCSWSGQGGRRMVPLPPSGEFELRGIPPGVNLDFLVQASRSYPWSSVTLPFRAIPAPRDAAELVLDLEFVPATQLTVRVEDARLGGATSDPFDLTLTASGGSWSREWNVPGGDLRTWVPSGPAVGRCHATGADPVVKSVEIRGAADVITFTLR